MPELPEVQTIVSDLNKLILHKKIKKIDILLPKIIKGDYLNFIKILKNNSFQNIQRRGKYIIFSLKNNQAKFLVVHLRMTGQLIYIKNQNIVAGGHSFKNNNFLINSFGTQQFDLPNRQTHLIFYFQDQSRLFYNDQRQFGYLEIIKQNALDEIYRKLGEEPLSQKFTLEYFQKLLKNSRRNIKAFLLDQKNIAGLGNIYVDESLFRAHILPSRLINSLNDEEIRKLYQAIKYLLKKAIEHRGTTFNNYKDAYGRQGNFTKLLKVYARDGKKCFHCQRTIIKKIKIAGRGTRYCPNCQK